MKSEEIFLFDGMEARDKKKIISCLGIHSAEFSEGETVCDFEKDAGEIGIVMSGSVSLVRADASGGRTVLECLGENDVLGETSAFSPMRVHGMYAVCEKRCEIAFMAYEGIAKRCEKACRCHTVAVENIFRGVVGKTRRMAERVEIISNRTIREKLMCLFNIYARRAESRTFELPFSLSYLAEYICADRSAMMREIKRMSDEGLVRTDRRRIELLH